MKMLSEKPTFKDYPNTRPIDWRHLKKFKGRVYTEEVLFYNPFETKFIAFLCKFISDDIVYIDRRLFEYRAWTNKRILKSGKKSRSISMSKRIKIHRIFDTKNQMLAYKLRET